jgi:cell division initiation protein
MFDIRTGSGTGDAATPERSLKVAPLDLRKHRFRSSFMGFDRAEVTTFMAEAADDYERALLEIDRLRQEVAGLSTHLAEHREREANLRNTLLTAQRLADDVRQNAQHEARLMITEAEGRADLLLQKAQARLDEIGREITELKLRRRDVEGSVEAAISALHHALEFIRTQDTGERDERLALHRPRQSELKGGAPAPPGPQQNAGGGQPR